MTAYITAMSMFAELPAFQDAPLAASGFLPELPPELPPEPAAEADGGQDPPLTRSRGQKKNPLGAFPCIFFSHGLGGSRTLYSSICGELASYGFVVVALELRDGSGTHTYVNLLDEKQKDGLGQPCTNEGRGRHRQDVLDYMFPLDNTQDTRPNNPRGVDTELRSAQIDMRLAEMEEAYSALHLSITAEGMKWLNSTPREKAHRRSPPRILGI